MQHPVTVKFRKGYREGEDIAVEFARMMEDAGVAAVAVHGRTAAQFYTGRADWDVIARVKQAVDVPVIGNGDVKSGADAAALVARTRCDAVMIHLVYMRKHAMWYLRGIPGAARARGALNRCVTLADFDEVFAGVLEEAARIESGEAACSGQAADRAGRITA